MSTFIATNTSTRQLKPLHDVTQLSYCTINRTSQYYFVQAIGYASKLNRCLQAGYLYIILGIHVCQNSVTPLTEDEN